MAKNKIAPNRGTLEQATEVTLAVRAWVYDGSVEKTRGIVKNWESVTMELARELYYAHEFLTNQQGQYKDPAAPDYISHTWQGYCASIELAVPTANRWLKLFVPAQLSETGEDHLLTVEELKALKALSITKYTGREQEKRIALVMNGGPRPADFTNEEERIIKARQEARHLEELTAIYLERKFDLVPRQDYFKNILAKTKAIKQFRLKTTEQLAAQMRMFDALDMYLKMFPDKESRLAAAANLTAQIRDAVNYLIERDFVQEGAEA